MTDAVSTTPDGTLVKVELTPGADEDRFPAGFNEWRGRVQARVSAQPQHGQANLALCRLVAETLELPVARVELVHGHTSRRKTLLLRGIEPDQVRERLGGVLPG